MSRWLTGEQAFDSLIPATCHSVAGIGGKSAPGLARREARGGLPADLAAAMWSRQFENEGGNAARGEQLFKQKACAGCHGSSAPYLAHGEESSSSGVVAVPWRHGPERLSQIKSRKAAWPQFTGAEVSDVIAYMKSSKQAGGGGRRRP